MDTSRQRRLQQRNRTAGAVGAAVEGGGTTETVISTVELIVLGRDHRLYEWTTRGEVQLAGSAADILGGAYGRSARTSVRRPARLLTRTDVPARRAKWTMTDLPSW